MCFKKNIRRTFEIPVEPVYYACESTDQAVPSFRVALVASRGLLDP